MHGLIVAVAAIAATAGLWAQTSDSGLGTWTLNVAKSTYDPGPAPKSQIVRIEVWGDGLKLTADAVDAAGQPAHSEYAAKFDGKDYPWKGNVNADTVALRRIDDRTIETVWKKGGNVTITLRAIVSSDGKTRTSTQTGVDAQGRRVNHRIVHERQQ